ncbi:MAG: hypothetical protein CMJ83_15275 [Planctomycetes bacterium]|nr:hypothetical protein [Planctomycetota bacterium]
MALPKFALDQDPTMHRFLRLWPALLVLLPLVSGQGATHLASASAAGVQATGSSGAPKISDNGRWIAFYSRATNLTGNATGNQAVFLKDFISGATEMISISTTGAPANLNCYSSGYPSDDGSVVAFACDATNLVVPDTNGRADAFVRDRTTGMTTRVSVSTSGVQGNERSWPYSMTPDGRYVVITSLASNFTVGDTNGAFDVFLHDRQLAVTEVISASPAGVIGDLESRGGPVAADGRYVIFDSAATNLVTGDGNGTRDVFRRDRLSGVTVRVSVSATGIEGNGSSVSIGVSPDGRYVMFNSVASNLIVGDTNGTSDIFVKDMATGLITQENVSSSGVQGDGGCLNTGAISANGRIVVFTSLANNLTANDTNIGSDAFVRDRLLGTTSLLTVNAAGVQSGIPCFFFPSNPCGGQYLGTEVSRDGRVVILDHTGGALVPGGDLNGGDRDIIVNDWSYQLSSLAPISVSQSGSLDLSARFDPLYAYVLGLSLDYTPGIPIGPRRVPLNADWLLDLSLTLGPPVFVGFTGNLDSNGRAVTSVNLPNDPALIGASFRACFLTIDQNFPLARGISNSLGLTVNP